METKIINSSCDTSKLRSKQTSKTSFLKQVNRSVKSLTAAANTVSLPPRTKPRIRSRKVKKHVLVTRVETTYC